MFFFISTDARNSHHQQQLFSPRFLLLRRVDIVHVGLKARERWRRETELGRKGLEPRRGCDRHRFFFFLFSIAKEWRRRVSFFSSSSSSSFLFTKRNVSFLRTRHASAGLCGRRSAFSRPRVSARVQEDRELSRRDASRGNSKERKQQLRTMSSPTMPTNSGAAVPRNARSSSLAAGRSSGSLRDEDDDDDDYDDEGGGRLSELYPRYASRFDRGRNRNFVGFLSDSRSHSNSLKTTTTTK